MGRYNYSNAGANYFFGDSMVRLLRPVAFDENLKWEETTTYNIGLDYGFLDNRISGTLDYYYRETEDLLNTVAIPAGTNFSNQLLTNVGELTNRGFEFSVTGRPIVGKDLSWNLSYNIAYNENEIKKLTVNDDPDYEVLSMVASMVVQVIIS
ncbi:TonB-dependent receptor domain-containing protein [Marinilabilia salmonicolor]|uniref:TonB-dependent receptor domain-containing protein n=1 Tax=Marinilabilia salmonicolor TaxID=989 RepID=UPI000AB8F593|nr:TonB-dependent receptor [Marinilabilia salmonicolor]